MAKNSFVMKVTFKRYLQNYCRNLLHMSSLNIKRFLYSLPHEFFWIQIQSTNSIQPHSTFCYTSNKVSDNTFKVTEGIFSWSSVIGNKSKKHFVRQ